MYLVKFVKIMTNIKPLPLRRHTWGRPRIYMFALPYKNKIACLHLTHFADTSIGF